MATKMSPPTTSRNSIVRSFRKTVGSTSSLPDSTSFFFSSSSLGGVNTGRGSVRKVRVVDSVTSAVGTLLVSAAFAGVVFAGVEDPAGAVGGVIVVGAALLPSCVTTAVPLCITEKDSADDCLSLSFSLACKLVVPMVDDATAGEDVGACADGGSD